jgi:hypothetical protein
LNQGKNNRARHLLKRGVCARKQTPKHWYEKYSFGKILSILKAFSMVVTELCVCKGYSYSLDAVMAALLKTITICDGKLGISILKWGEGPSNTTVVILNI